MFIGARQPAEEALATPTPRTPLLIRITATTKILRRPMSVSTAIASAGITIPTPVSWAQFVAAAGITQIAFVFLDLDGRSGTK